MVFAETNPANTASGSQGVLNPRLAGDPSPVPRRPCLLGLALGALHILET